MDVKRCECDNIVSKCARDVAFSQMGLSKRAIISVGLAAAFGKLAARAAFPIAAPVPDGADVPLINPAGLFPVEKAASTANITIPAVRVSTGCCISRAATRPHTPGLCMILWVPPFWLAFVSFVE